MLFNLYTLKEKFIKQSSEIPKDFTGMFINVVPNIKVWSLKGKHHRIGGPALEYLNEPNGKIWIINGKRVTKEEHDLLYSIMKLKGLL